jgi:hypothetical protein
MYSPALNSEGPLAKGILLYVLQMTLNVLKKSSTMSFIGPVLHLFRGPFGKGFMNIPYHLLFTPLIPSCIFVLEPLGFEPGNIETEAHDYTN